MTDELRALLSDPLTYVVVAAIVWLSKLWIDRTITSKVNSRFAQRLETHKHELSLNAESVRFEHQKRLADVTLYAAKKHEAAAAIYGKFREAHGHISRYNGLRVTLTFEEFNADDLSAYMTERQVPGGMRDQILTEWRTNKESGLSTMNKYLRMLELQEAERVFQEAKNLTYLNELYLSDEAIKAIDNLVNVLGRALALLKYPPERGEKVDRPNRAEMDKVLEGVHASLRRELAGEPSKQVEATLTDRRQT